jgi:hypothetical protein
MNGQICLKKVNGVKYLETKGVYKICSGLVKVYIVWRSIVSNFGAKLKKKSVQHLSMIWSCVLVDADTFLTGGATAIDGTWRMPAPPPPSVLA